MSLLQRRPRLVGDSDSDGDVRPDEAPSNLTFHAGIAELLQVEPQEAVEPSHPMDVAVVVKREEEVPAGNNHSEMDDDDDDDVPGGQAPAQAETKVAQAETAVQEEPHHKDHDQEVGSPSQLDDSPPSIPHVEPSPPQQPQQDEHSPPCDPETPGTPVPLLPRMQHEQVLPMVVTSSVQHQDDNDEEEAKDNVEQAATAVAPTAAAATLSQEQEEAPRKDQNNQAIMVSSPQDQPAPNVARASGEQDGESDGDIINNINNNNNNNNSEAETPIRDESRKLPRQVYVRQGKVVHLATLVALEGPDKARVKWDYGKPQVVPRDTIEELPQSTRAGNSVHNEDDDLDTKPAAIRRSQRSRVKTAVYKPEAPTPQPQVTHHPKKRKSKEAKTPAKSKKPKAVKAPQQPVSKKPKAVKASRQPAKTEEIKIPKPKKRLEELLGGLFASDDPVDAMRSLDHWLAWYSIDKACRLDTHIMVVEAMKEYPSFRDVQHHGMASIQKLAIDHDRAKFETIQEGGIDVIVAAIHKFPNDVVIQKAVSNTLDVLTGDVDATNMPKEVANAWRRFLRGAGPKQLIKNMNETFRDDAKYLEFTAEFFANLAASGTAFRTFIKEDLFALIIAVTGATHRFNKRTQVYKSADKFMNALYNTGR